MVGLIYLFLQINIVLFHLSKNVGQCTRKSIQLKYRIKIHDYYSVALILVIINNTESCSSYRHEITKNTYLPTPIRYAPGFNKIHPYSPTHQLL